MKKGWYRQQEDDDDNGFAEWGGYMAAKKAKLVQQVRESAVGAKSKLFENVAIFVNGHTQPSAEALRQLMAEHSGTFHVYQMPTTTHIIASNLCNVKMGKLGTLPVVQPSWISDSVTAGRLLDCSSYLLRTNRSRTQPQLAFAKTASDPAFLDEFYAHSRLHLIATLASELKEAVGEWRRRADHPLPGRARLAHLVPPSGGGAPPLIMHVDMDCFFVSVALRTRPELRGRPVAVTHARRGAADSLAEVACCSYEARAHGVRNGTSVGEARRRCPPLVTIPYDFAGYRRAAHALYAAVGEYTLDIEPVSCDELYADVRSLTSADSAAVAAFAHHVRRLVRTRTGCACSTGFGGSRLLARLATRRAKPDGWRHLAAGDVDAHMRTLPLAELPGVGRATLARLAALGATTCGDAQALSLPAALAARVRGVDARPLRYAHARHSVSAEVSYGVRFGSAADGERFLVRLADEAAARLLAARMRAKRVTLKLMLRAAHAPQEAAKYLGHGACDTVTRSAPLPRATADAPTISRCARALYDRLAPPFADLRGVGVHLTRLEAVAPTSGPMERFLRPPKGNEDAVDEVQSGFGRLDHEQFVGMLAKWTQCHVKPLQVDVDMLADHLVHMVGQRRIERVLIYIRLLHRHIRDLNRKEWTLAFGAICDRLQAGMVATYGKPMIVPTL